MPGLFPLSPGKAGPLALALVALWAAQAAAADFGLSAQTLSEGFEIRSADGTLLTRRRIVQNLYLTGYNLASDHVSMGLLLRIDSDVGDGRLEAGLPPELQSIGVDLMLAHVDARDLFDVLSITLGRQLIMEDGAFLHMDGLRATLVSPVHLGLDLHLGMQVKRDMFILGSATFEPDGTETDDAIATVVGAALTLTGIPWIRARAGYRRAFSGAVDEELAGGSIWLRPLAPLEIQGYLSASLLHGAIDRGGARASLTILEHTRLTADYIYSLPIFDGDSIFNVFVIGGFNDVRVTAAHDVGEWLTMQAGVDLRLADDESEPERGLILAVEARQGTRGRAMLTATLWDGPAGFRFGGEARGGLGVWGDRLSFELSLALVQFKDGVNAELEGLSFTGGVSATVRLPGGPRVLLVVEDTVSPFYESAFRVLALLDLEFWFPRRLL